MSTRPSGYHEIYRALHEAPDTLLVTRAAREEFARAYHDVELAPLVVVIAAYNEGDNIGAVLDEVSDEIGGVAVTTLVIDDGSTDATTEVARRHGALVCTLSANRGHGVALSARMGKLLAAVLAGESDLPAWSYRPWSRSR